jgi:hypothetical protein
MPKPDGPQWEVTKVVVGKDPMFHENALAEKFAQEIEDVDVAKLLLDVEGTPESQLYEDDAE